MTNHSVSQSFQVFLKEAPEYSRAWMEAVYKLDSVSQMDKKTHEIAYIAVLAAVGLESGIPFHVKQAKELGVTRDEIKGAILIGLPAVGNRVVQSLSIAIDAFDEVDG